ncbi:HAD family hydrolase [Xenorhabdus bovienii]|uniref:HAD family hydrolase n=1 Tax=Xenorhabdus bovienii TaxID=40576 RepID=UPI003DA639BF
MPNNKIIEKSCIVFDLDGTLVDTWNIHLKTCYETVLEITGMKYRKLDIIRANKVTERETLVTLLGEMYSEEALRFYTKRFIDNLELYEVKIFSGIEDILKSLNDIGCKVGLFTGRKKETTIYLLEKINIFEYFRSIITSDDVVHSKPSTEGLVKVIKELNGMNEVSLYIGDTLTDIKIASKLKVCSILVNWNDRLLLPREDIKTIIVDKPDALLFHIRKFIGS